MTPRLSEKKNINYRISRGQAVLEIAFERLKTRWRLLQKQISMHFLHISIKCSTSMSLQSTAIATRNNTIPGRSFDCFATWFCVHVARMIKHRLVSSTLQRKLFWTVWTTSAMWYHSRIIVTSSANRLLHQPHMTKYWKGQMISLNHEWNSNMRSTKNRRFKDW